MNGAHLELAQPAPPAGTAELGEVLRAILARLDSIDGRVAALEANTESVPALVEELEGFRPLLESARKRMDRGSHLAGMFGGKGRET